LLLVNRLRDLRARAGRGKDKALNEYAQGLVPAPATACCGYLQKDRRGPGSGQRRPGRRDTIMALDQGVGPRSGAGPATLASRPTSPRPWPYALSLYADPGHAQQLSQVYEQVRRRRPQGGKHWQIGGYATTVANYLKRLGRRLHGHGPVPHGNKALRGGPPGQDPAQYDEIPPLFMLCGDHHISRRSS
jgi:hypothetical protein